MTIVQWASLIGIGLGVYGLAVLARDLGEHRPAITFFAVSVGITTAALVIGLLGWVR